MPWRSPLPASRRTLAPACNITLDCISIPSGKHSRIVGTQRGQPRGRRPRALARRSWVGAAAAGGRGRWAAGSPGRRQANQIGGDGRLGAVVEAQGPLEQDQRAPGGLVYDQER